jgi:hypothetical protein
MQLGMDEGQHADASLLLCAYIAILRQGLRQGLLRMMLYVPMSNQHYYETCGHSLYVPPVDVSLSHFSAGTFKFLSIYA